MNIEDIIRTINNVATGYLIFIFDIIHHNIDCDTYYILIFIVS